jgi:hypothetical protein
MVCEFHGMDQDKSRSRIAGRLWINRSLHEKVLTARALLRTTSSPSPAVGKSALHIDATDCIVLRLSGLLTLDCVESDCVGSSLFMPSVSL